MEPTAYLQPAEKIEEKPDTEYTKSMRRQFPLFGIGCLLYSAFYAFCLYRNASGITYPFFVAGTLCCFFFSMKKLGVPFKKDSVFYIAGITLLGISNCMTASPQILRMNKWGIFLLTCILMLHTIYDDKTWNFNNYFFAIFRTIGSFFCCLVSPFGDMVSYFDAKKQEINAKKSYFLPVFAGFIIALPLLFCITLLLVSADAVFAHMLSRLMEALNIWTAIEIVSLMTVVFFSSYAVLSGLCRKEVKEQTKEKNRFDSVIAIVISSLLCLLYMVFSIVQILYLFIGNMELPENYTYARYARQGFFQLLIVSVINFLIVLIFLYLFRESKVLRVILTMICGCTFIMILSSALRMMLYIQSYALTFLRLFVLWALAVIFFLMAGVTAYIFYRQFPLFFYGLSVVTICYIALSFSHPDYLVAKYNLTTKFSDEYELPACYDSSEGPRVANCDVNYLSLLSADAAPAILNPAVNPYFTNIEDMLEKTAMDSNGSYNADYYYDQYWIKRYYSNIEECTKFLGMRNFNFSLYNAKKYVE